MLPKCGTSSLIPLWYMLDTNKASVRRQRCILFLARTSQEVSVCSTKQNPIHSQNASCLWLWQVCAESFKEMKCFQSVPMLTSICLCRKTWSSECFWQTVNNHIVTYVHSPLSPFSIVFFFPFFEERFSLPQSSLINLPVSVCMNTCQWIGSCALSPCGVFMLWACAKFNQTPQLHDYLGKLWNEILQQQKKKYPWLGLKIISAVGNLLNPVWS